MTSAAAEWVSIWSLHVWDDNPRINEKAIPRVKASIRKFGFVSPCVVWKDRLVAGHTRCAALHELYAEDRTFVPKGAPGPGLVKIVRHDFKDEHEANLYAVADNALGEIAEWDETKLVDLVAKYTPEDLVVAGLDEYVAKLDIDGARDDDNAEVPEVTDPKSKDGDVYVLGDHRVVCGVAEVPDYWLLVLGKEKPTCMWTDPPYGVKYEGKTKKKLTIQNDDLSESMLHTIVHHAMMRAADFMIPGAAAYVAHPAGAKSVIFARAFLDAGWRLHETLVWKKDAMVLGHSDYHYIHEPILFGYSPGGGRRGRGGAGWYGDNSQVSVFEVPRPKSSEEHPTMKPVQLIVPHLLNSSDRNDVVVDPFGGSGSTLLACERTGRRARLIEKDPCYVDVIVSRWEKATGRKAVLEHG